MLIPGQQLPLAVGSRIRVVSYGPFRGLKGTIRTVDAIPQLDDPCCFYHIELEGSSIKEPVWFEHEEVELLAPHAQVFRNA